MNINVPSVSDKVVLCTAFDLAMAELARQRPFRSDTAKLKETVMTAILELAQSGNGDPQKLANHAIDRCGRHS